MLHAASGRQGCSVRISFDSGTNLRADSRHATGGGGVHEHHGRAGGAAAAAGRPRVADPRGPAPQRVPHRQPRLPAGTGGPRHPDQASVIASAHSLMLGLQVPLITVLHSFSCASSHAIAQSARELRQRCPSYVMHWDPQPVVHTELRSTHVACPWTRAPKRYIVTEHQSGHRIDIQSRRPGDVTGSDTPLICSVNMADHRLHTLQVRAGAGRRRAALRR